MRHRPPITKNAPFHMQIHVIYRGYSVCMACGLAQPAMPVVCNMAGWRTIRYACAEQMEVV